MRSKFGLVMSLSILALMWPGARASAQLVPITLNSGCAVNAASVDFGTGDFRREATAHVDVAVTCPAGYQFTIALLQMPGCDSERTMIQGRYEIRYAIVTPDGTNVWCDGSNGTGIVTGIGTGGPQHFIGTATILSTRGAGVADGQYDDTIMVVVS